MIVPDLREINLGTWDGTLINKHQNEPEFNNYFHHPDKFDPTDIHAESFPDLLARGRAVVSDVYKSNVSDSNILIVGHGVFLTVLINNLLGIPLSNVRSTGTIANNSVTVLNTAGNMIFTKKIWNFVPSD